MTTWYEVPMKYGRAITTVEVLRDTEHSIFTEGYRGRERRRAKEDSYSKYVPTIEEAVSLLRDRLEKEVRRAQERVVTTIDELAAFTAEYGEQKAVMETTANCRARHSDGWICTLDTGHDGDHEARDIRLHKTWPEQEVAEKTR